EGMNRNFYVIAIFSLLALSAGAHAEVGIAGTAGTLGLGAELTIGGSSQLEGRLGIHGYEYSERREASDIEYDGEASLRTATGFLDWHPGGRGFRLTGGLVYNATEVTGSSLPPASGVYDIGGVPVPVALVGTLDGKVEFDPIVPYAGLGWGRAPGSGSGFGVTLDLGVIFQGEGEVTLTPIIPAGSPLNNPVAREALQILIEREERDLQENIVDYDMYPVVSLGISYRF
ncbi:MAG TPA: hypothetical protein VNW71_01910, partial [Thermoanaerobaculia bacterium]|nr:hypothetical protein [Thermoanaerobaculia bacterium]